MKRLKLEIRKFYSLMSMVKIFASSDTGTVHIFKNQLPHHLIDLLLKNNFNVREISIKLAIKDKIVEIDKESIHRLLDIFEGFNKIPSPPFLLDSLTSFVESCANCIVHIFRAVEKKYSSISGLLLSVNCASIPYNCINEYFRVKHIERASLVHGDSFYVCNYWDIAEFHYADMHIVSNKIYLDAVNDIYQSPQYIESDLRYRSIKRMCYYKSIQSKKQRKKILYLPTIYRGSDTRFFKNALDYPSVWYYKLQKLIVNYLLDNKYHVKYKAFPGDSAENPFLSYTNEWLNLEYSTKPFVDTFGEFDIMITDFPSTGMLECIYAGIPCAAVYPHELPIMSTAEHLKGKALFSFKDFDELPNILSIILNKSNQDLLEPVKNIFSIDESAKRVNDLKVINHFLS